MLPWAVRDLAADTIVGTSRYHDMLPAMDRVEIGYTFYAQRCHRTAVNTTCKLLLLGHAFDTLGCRVVGLRTDNFNFRSQRAIEALGAKRDGVIRHFGLRRAAPPRARTGGRSGVRSGCRIPGFPFVYLPKPVISTPAEDHTYEVRLPDLR
jgi:RimJ/RimL family protein N-acetyltransferase